MLRIKHILKISFVNALRDVIHRFSEVIYFTEV